MRQETASTTRWWMTSNSLPHSKYAARISGPCAMLRLAWPRCARRVDDAHRVRRDAGDGLPLQDGTRRDLPAGAADAGDDLQAENGVAAEREEVVVDAGARNAEHGLPRFAQRALRVRRRG